MLLSLAKEYLENEAYGKAIDERYGAGVTRYTAEAIQRYTGL